MKGGQYGNIRNTDYRLVFHIWLNTNDSRHICKDMPLNLITHRRKLDIAISLLDERGFELWKKKVTQAENRVKRKRHMAMKEAEANGKAFRTTRCEKNW